MNSGLVPWLALAVMACGSAGACGVVPVPLLNLTHQTERAKGLPQNILVSLVWAESRYCVRAVSEAGALGLGQLMPSTARALGVQDPFDPAANLWGAATYLREQHLSFGDWSRALLAYHDGPTRVREGRVTQRGLNYAAFVLGTYQAIVNQGGLR